MAFTIIAVVTFLGAIGVNGCPATIPSVNESCCEIQGAFRFSTSIKSRVYTITNFCGDCEQVAEGYCDFTSAGGGWLVIQRRQDGSVNFDRDWVDYENGFGSLTGEFWYGLIAIHCLTNRGQWKLRIDYTFTNGTKGYLSYSNFRVGPASEQYPLTISGFDGGNDLFHTTRSHSSYSLNGWKFTTRDRDNDRWRQNCAVDNSPLNNGGGWWYNHCSALYLNHQYNKSFNILLNGKTYILPFIEIKIRPKDCNI